MGMHWNLSSGLPPFNMASACLYCIILLASLAMLLFMAGFVGFHLGLGFIAAGLYGLAVKILLFAFALLLVWGFLAILRGLSKGLSSYFCQEATALRRILSVHIQSHDFSRRIIETSRQLNYRSQFKRQRLLLADNRRQLKKLYLAIREELQAVRPELPAGSYQILHKTLRKHWKQADAEAMLAVRQQIICRD